MLKKTVRWAAVVACTATVGLTALTGCGDKKMTPDQKMAAMNSAPGDIIDVATGPNMEDVTTLVKAVKAAGLVDTLKGPGPFTVFAPTNDAFNDLPAGTLDNLMKPENKEQLKAILLYHVHPGSGILASEVQTMQLSTADGNKVIDVMKDGDTVKLNGKAKVVKADIICTNGVIHWIDHVLMPPSGMSPMMNNGM